MHTYMHTYNKITAGNHSKAAIVILSQQSLFLLREENLKSRSKCKKTKAKTQLFYTMNKHLAYWLLCFLTRY